MSVLHIGKNTKQNMPSFRHLTSENLLDKEYQFRLITSLLKLYHNWAHQQFLELVLCKQHLHFHLKQ